MTSTHSHTITIRSYEPGDARTLTSLFRASVRGMSMRDYTTVQISAWAPDVIHEVQFGQRCEGKSTWIAEVQGRVAGFSDIEPDGHVDMLYVHPEFQRRGIARALLKHIEKEACRKGQKRLYTEASITARPLFEAMGFRVIVPQTVVVRGVSMTNFRMEKV